MRIQFLKNRSNNNPTRGLSAPALFSWCLIAIMVFTQFACSDDDETLSAKEELVMKDVSYGNDPLNTMDIHLPANRSSKTKW